MKTAQAPIYRAIERLMVWAVPMVAHLPKAVSYEHLGGLMIHDLHESMAAVGVALQSDDDHIKLSAVDAIISRMTSLKTTMRVLLQVRHGGAPVVSRRKEAEFLDLLTPVARQAAAWRNSIVQKSRH